MPRLSRTRVRNQARRKKALLLFPWVDVSAV